jgi:hypothetical protein
VHEYDAAKKKKKKGKGNLFIGNGMICYGSETDKSLPVQQYPILDVTKYLYDGKNLHIEIDGAKQAVLDLQASSKSEAKAVLVKIADSLKAAQMSNTHINNNVQVQRAAPAPAIIPVQPSPIQHHQQPEEPEQEEEEEESNCVPKWGISIYSFQAEGGDELSVEENEQIYVLDYERTDGWWRVQKVDGDIGLVPSSYVQFDGEEDNSSNVAGIAAAGGIAAATAVAAAAVSSRTDNIEDIRRKRDEEERALKQQRMVEEEAAREEQRRRDEQLEQQKRQEQLRKEEELRRRREEEERDRRKQVQEAAKRAEVARQKQLEEDYRRKEQERKAALARSASKSNRHQDLPKPDPTKIRTWTDRSGSFKVEAQFIDFHNGKLRLHKLNGVKIDVPVEKMCAEDVRWVENNTRNLPQQEVTPSMPPRPPQQPPQQPTQKKLNERWDWFDWFMIIGIPMQASLQYASAFKAEKLDDSDVPNLTHKQMKTLGIKEEHVQRIERYIETGKPEDNEEETKQKQSQIEKDEELAKKLQKEWESSEGAKGKCKAVVD